VKIFLPKRFRFMRPGRRRDALSDDRDRARRANRIVERFAKFAGSRGLRETEVRLSVSSRPRSNLRVISNSICSERRAPALADRISLDQKRGTLHRQSEGTATDPPSVSREGREAEFGVRIECKITGEDRDSGCARPAPARSEIQVAGHEPSPSRARD
jgi:hypothetical protein